MGNRENSRNVHRSVQLVCCVCCDEKNDGSGKDSSQQEKNICPFSGSSHSCRDSCFSWLLLSASLAETQYILSKYTDPSFIFEADTAGFRLQLIGLLFSIVLWIMLFFYFDLFGSYCRRNAEPYKGTKLIVRLTCLIITVVIGMGAKMLLWPIGSLANYENISTQNHSVKKGINDIYSITAISRKLNYTESELVYKNTRVTLRYGEQPILKFSRKINQEEGRLQKISLSETDLAYRYDLMLLHMWITEHFRHWTKKHQ